MKQSFIHTSESNNFYIYNDLHRLSMLIHPEFKKIFETTTNIDQYYLGKYKYLKNYAFFSETNPNNFETTINETMIKNSIIQTPQIVFEVTDSCNMKCIYCSFGDLYEGYDVRNNKKINTNNAITLLKHIFDIKHKNQENNLSIAFYGGEPLLNIKFIKQIVKISNQLSYEKEIDINYLITTNASIIHKYIDFFVENKFKILISLDGNEENQSYRIFRKNNKNSFQKVLENIDMIQIDYPEYFSSNVNFNAVLHNRNSVKEIYDFIYKRYNKIPRIAELSLVDVRPDKKELVEIIYHNKQKSEIEYHNEESTLLNHEDLLLFKELTFFLKYYTINFYLSNLNALLQIDEKSLPTNTCFPFSKKIFLTNNNKLLFCEKVNYKYTMGEINQNVIFDIPKITQQYNFYYRNFKRICQHCYAYRFCGVCMFQLKNLEQLGTEEFVCERFQDQKTFQTKLYRIFSFLEKYPNDFTEIIENVIIA